MHNSQIQATCSQIGQINGPVLLAVTGGQWSVLNGILWHSGMPKPSANSMRKLLEPRRYGQGRRTDNPRLEAVVAKTLSRLVAVKWSSAHTLRVTLDPWVQAAAKLLAALN